MYRKIFAIAVILTATSFSLSAQDVIVMKDSRKIEVKVMDVNVNDVKYKMFTNQDGPTYTLLKSDIASILYQNGNVESFVSDAGTSFTSSAVGTPLTYKGGVRQDGIKLKPYEVKKTMVENYEALYHYRTGRAYRTTGYVITGFSAWMFTGWVIQKIDGWNSPEIFWPAIGGLAAGLTLVIIGDSRVKKSVTLYNSKLTGYSAVPYQINFGFTQTGVGLTMRF